MTSTRSHLTRRFVLGALTSAAVLAAAPAMAEGHLMDVRIINRDSGQTLPVYPFKGDLWVAGEPGARYAVQLHNTTRGRLLNVVSVDGVNVVSGETAAWNQTGYVLDSWQRYDVAGWRKSSKDIAAFEFTHAPRSYAARTDRPNDVGVIGVAVFREKQPAWRDREDAQRYERRAPEAPSAQGKALPKSGPANPAFRFDHNGPGEQALGTGHGDRERDRVGSTEFQRDTKRPDEVIRIRYDSYDNLVAMGVIPTYRGRYRGPSAFPAQRSRWVPDPR